MALAAGAPPVLAAIVFAINSNAFGSITHYSSGQSAIYYGQVSARACMRASCSSLQVLLQLCAAPRALGLRLAEGHLPRGRHLRRVQHLALGHRGWAVVGLPRLLLGCAHPRARSAHSAKVAALAGHDASPRRPGRGCWQTVATIVNEWHCGLALSCAMPVPDAAVVPVGGPAAHGAHSRRGPPHGGAV
eukprot:scaffold539_cov359-Prasinococcus_capsulatus_cf.AAC.16